MELFVFLFVWFYLYLFFNRLSVLNRYKTDEYNYLQKSVIPTLHFQKSLPKLPIPKLEDTCKRYLNSLKPLLNEDDYKRVEKLVKNFEKNDSIVLDKQIRASDAVKRDSNYIKKMNY